ncbi:hypothetical protein J4226_04830 [Candidatus Pacearchaeota archaeon]|nr:hypothetical protein [Candidatus Pacearchaeota archaeon]
MCFTPWVSLTTAIVEFVVASFILFRYKNYLVPVFSAIFVYILGFYQFSEFMLCVSSNSFLWASVGFATYTFLPAVGLHMAIRFTNTKFWNWVLYVFPVVVTFIVFIKEDFILNANCSWLFVYVETFLYSSKHLFLSIAYLTYYFGFILIVGVIFLLHIKKRNMHKIYYFWIIIGTVTIIAPLLLLSIFPAMGLAFPSIYCEFALAYTISAILGSEIYSKRDKRENF